jgi:hypothetical protein
VRAKNEWRQLNQLFLSCVSKKAEFRPLSKLSGLCPQNARGQVLHGLSDAFIDDASPKARNAPSLSKWLMSSEVFSLELYGHEGRKKVMSQKPTKGAFSFKQVSWVWQLDPELRPQRTSKMFFIAFCKIFLKIFFPVVLMGCRFLCLKKMLLGVSQILRLFTRSIGAQATPQIFSRVMSSGAPKSGVLTMRNTRLTKKLGHKTKMLSVTDRRKSNMRQRTQTRKQTGNYHLDSYQGDQGKCDVTNYAISPFIYEGAMLPLNTTNSRIFSSFTQGGY